RTNVEENRLIGYFNQLVIHHDRLTFAQSGLTHAYWIDKNGALHLFDPELAGKGLGITKGAALRFFQTQINPGDSLILTLQPAVGWNELYFAGLYGQGPESIRRKLLQNNLRQTEVIMLHFQSGTGKTIVLPSKPTAISAQPEFDQKEKVSKEPATVDENIIGQKSADINATPKEPTISEPIHRDEQTVEAVTSAEIAERVESDALTAEFVPPPIPENVSTLPNLPHSTDNTLPVTQSSPAIHAAETLPTQASRKSFLSKLADTMGKGLEKLKPIGNVFIIPTPIMAIIAILVPLIVVSFASAIYLRQGQVSEFEEYLVLAQQSAKYATEQTNPITQRTAWITVLKYVDEAEQYGQSDETQLLRARAQTALDQLDYIQRINFMSALSEGLASDANITKMIATENELFLLDATSGVVWRAESVAKGYVLHPEASCGAGINGLKIGKLIGFSVEKQVNEVYSVIRAADDKGNVVTCQANQTPKLEKLNPPETGMGILSGFLVERGNYYLLDPQKNAVWIYWGGKSNQKPELFFSQDIPPMKNILDYAVYQDDLYLLYQDGHLVQCAYNSITPTRCTDPQPYKDARPGRESQILKPEVPFNRIFASQAPDPALYFLEPATPAIYQFSLRSLAFHVQYRQNPLSTYTALPTNKAASALTISTDHRLAFLAYGNLIYYASLP
ncbi:MAG: hypothetical protein ACPL6F_00665, partial [Anaerolineales bacterium]